MRHARTLAPLTLAAGMCLALVTGGCRSAIPPLVRSDIEFTRELADGSKTRFRARNPKDLALGGLRLDPQTGTVEITNYTSAANVDVLQARQHEAAQQRMAFQEGMTRLESMAYMMAAAKVGQAVLPPGAGAPAAEGWVALGQGALLVPTNQVADLARALQGVAEVVPGIVLQGRQYVVVKPLAPVQP